MNYLLVREEQLAGQGYDYRYNERIPDGRIILPMSAVKVLSNFTPEIISEDNLIQLIKDQKDSGLYDIPEEGASGGEGDNPETPPAGDEQIEGEGGTA